MAEDPFYNLVVFVVVGYRRPPRSTARQRVDLGDILPAASGVASPSLAVRRIVET